MAQGRKTGKPPARRKPKAKLTPGEKRFITEYPIDLNGAAAAIRAGYKETTAAAAACRMLKKPAVADAISKALEARAKKVGIDAEWVLREAAALFEKAKNSLGAVPSASMVSAANGVLATIGKHVNVQAFKDKVEHSGPGGGAIPHEIVLKGVRANVDRTGTT